MIGYPLFEITDGTNTIRFFGVKSPYRLQDWTPAVAQEKNGGVWNNPLFTDGKQLISVSHENIIDTFAIAITGRDHDNLTENIRKLVELLEKAQAYWTTQSQTQPVYLVARGDNETNTRYAIIKAYNMPNYGNPFEHDADKVMTDITLVIEHGYWQKLPPGQSRQVAVSSIDCWDYPYTLYFDGLVQRIQINAYSAINDLADNAFTAEAWIYPIGRGGYETFGVTSGRIFDKTNSGNYGWYMAVTQSGNDLILSAYVICATTTASTVCTTAITPNTWHHVAMTWDDATDRKIYIFIDGVKQAATITQGVGTIVSDSSYALCIGNRFLDDPSPSSPAGFHGYIGWTRISNVVRYTETFTPPPRCKLPPIDSYTVGQWIKEGNGTTTYNQVGSGNNGTIAFSPYWARSCCQSENLPVTPLYSIEFDGSNSMAVVSLTATGYNNLPASTDMTVEAYIYLRDYVQSAYIVSKIEQGTTTQGWSLSVSATNANRLYVLMDFVTTDGIAYSLDNAIVANRWQHVAFTYTLSTKAFKVFVDGKNVTSYTVSGSGAYAGDGTYAPLTIGGHSSSWGHYLDGFIAWVRISNNIRYSGTYNTIPALYPPPATDANTLGLYYPRPYTVNKTRIANAGSVAIAPLNLYKCAYRRGSYLK